MSTGVRRMGASSYRWVVLGACVIALMASAGLRWSVGAFLPAWQQAFHADTATVSLAASAALLCYGLAQPLVGKALDRIGVRGVLTVGALLLGGGLLLTSRAGSPLLVDVAYGLVAGAGFAALAQVTSTVAITQWFPVGRGLPLGIANAGNSVGMLLLGPLALFLIRSVGWRQADVVLGVLALAVVTPVVWLLVRSPARSPAEAARREPPVRLAEVVRRRDFWFLAIPFFICGYTTNGLMGPHFVGFLDDDGFGLTVVAAAIGAMGGMNMVGSLLAGVLSDRIGRPLLLCVIYGVRAVALILMLMTHSVFWIVAFSGFYGMLDWATVPPTASLSADLFGRRGVGTAFAWITLSHQVGGAVSSEVAGLIVDRTGSYVPVFLLAAALLVVGTYLTSRLGRSPVPTAPGESLAAGVVSPVR